MGDNSEKSRSSSSPPSNPSAKTKKANLKEVQGAVKKESNRVNLLRTFLFLSILGVGAAISTLTYNTLSKALTDDAADAVSFFSTCLLSYTSCNLTHTSCLSMASLPPLQVVLGTLFK